MRIAVNRNGRRVPVMSTAASGRSPSAAVSSRHPEVVGSGGQQVEPGIADQQHAGRELGQQHHLSAQHAEDDGRRHQSNQQQVEADPSRRPVVS
jgi:hypothetical protein